MNEPESPAPGSDELMSQEELTEYLERHPEKKEEFCRTMRQSMERVVHGEFGAVAPEILAMAQAGLEKHHAHDRVSAATAKLKELTSVMSRPPGSMKATERISQCNALIEELVDLLLETPEPHRTRFMQQLLPIREELRAMAAKLK